MLMYFCFGFYLDLGSGNGARRCHDGCHVVVSCIETYGAIQIYLLLFLL